MQSMKYSARFTEDVAHFYMYTSRAQQEAIGSSETGFANGCDAPCGCLEPNPGSSARASALTSGLSLQRLTVPYRTQLILSKIILHVRQLNVSGCNGYIRLAITVGENSRHTAVC